MTEKKASNLSRASGMSNNSAKRASPMSCKAKLLDAGIILGTFCGCMAGVLWILKEALKSLVER
jgi:hypothetical protein